MCFFHLKFDRMCTILSYLLYSIKCWRKSWLGKGLLFSIWRKIFFYKCQCWTETLPKFEILAHYVLEFDTAAQLSFPDLDLFCFFKSATAPCDVTEGCLTELLLQKAPGGKQRNQRNRARLWGVDLQDWDADWRNSETTLMECERDAMESSRVRVKPAGRRREDENQLLTDRLTDSQHHTSTPSKFDLATCLSSPWTFYAQNKLNFSDLSNFFFSSKKQRHD